MVIRHSTKRATAPAVVVVCGGSLWFVVKGSCVGRWVAVLGEVWTIERWDLEDT